MITAGLSGRLPMHQMLVQELCYLQLRMICECVGLSCLIAHGDISDITLVDFLHKYAADDIIKMLEPLHSEFFPKPRIFTVIPPNDKFPKGNINIEDKLSPPSLTKSDLISLYGRCGEFLHRSRLGEIEHRPPYTKVCFEPIISWANKIISLLDNHMIYSRENDRYVLVFLKASDHGNKPLIVLANAPPKSAGQPPSDSAQEG